MSAAGWYPDPQDPGTQRYFDGHGWTEHQRVGAAPTEQPAASPPWWAAQTPLPPAAASNDQADRQWPTAAIAGRHQPPGDTGSAPTNTGAARRHRRRRRRTRPLVLGVVAILFAALLTGGYFAFARGRDAPTLTYQGARITDAGGVLRTSEHNLDVIVGRRHGARSPDTRCYFAVPDLRVSGAKSTDVDPKLRCGPVMFIDGDAGKQYLSFPLSGSGSGTSVTLAASSTPDRDGPVAVDGVELRRPDGKRAPSGAGGLTAPEPPAADADTLVAADPGSTAVPAAPKSAVLGSWSGGITLSRLGFVERYGTGDDARSAPPGQKLIAFASGDAEGDDGTSDDLTSIATISVVGARGRRVPDTGPGQVVVVAVPRAASSVDLILDDKGLKQSISLLDGRPDPGNIAVLGRRNRATERVSTTPAVFTFAPAVVFADGTSGTTENATVSFDYAELAYRNVDETTPVTASGRDKAIMHVGLTYVGAHDKGVFGFPSALLTFTPTGAATVRARNISTTPGKIYNVFEVPGGVTTGTLTLSGSVAQPYQGSADSYRFGLQKPVAIAISIPAG
jgi:Protein of unknown function (DUF2510)